MILKYLKINKKLKISKALLSNYTMACPG